MAAQKTPEAKITEAYKVIDAFVEGFQRIKSAKPEDQPLLLQQLKVEGLAKMPDLFQAIIALTPEQHWPAIYALFKNLADVAQIWNKQIKT